MKKYLLSIFLILSFFTAFTQQSDIIGNRVIANKSFYLKNNWFDSTKRGMDTSFTSDNQLATALAIKNMVEGRLGINVQSQVFKLKANNTIYINDTLPDGYNLSRMQFVPAKQGAFRAGFTNTGLWDMDKIGAYSAAFGQNNLAQGAASFSAGYNNTGSSNFSTTFGANNLNGGDYSFIAGSNNESHNIITFLTGNRNKTYGEASSAIGQDLQTKSKYELAVGRSNDTSQLSTDTLRLFEVGNGSQNGVVRSNILTATKTGVGIGASTTSPTTTLLVNGTLKLVVPGFANGKVLTSDASGNATWNDPSIGIETDPIFIAHPSYGITGTNITNWNSAFGWGNHAGLYRPITYIPTFASITGKPTTLSGYGITDAYPLTGNPSNFLLKSDSATYFTKYRSDTMRTNIWAAMASGGGGSGITSLNSLTGAVQTFATPGTSGTAPAWVSSGTAHTLNIPNVNYGGRGLVSNGAETIWGKKTFSSNVSPAATFQANANGMLILDSLTATADSQVVVGLRVAPVLNNGGFAGVAQVPLQLDWGNGNRFSVSSILGNGILTFHTGTTYTTSNYFLRTNGIDLIMNAPATAGGLFFRISNSNRMRIHDTTGNVVIENGLSATAPDIEESKLTINATDAGVLLPRMTRGNFNAISATQKGLLGYDTTLNKFIYKDGTANKVLLDSAAAAGIFATTAGVSSTYATLAGVSSTYATLAGVSSTYLPLAGGTMSGAIAANANNTLDIGASGTAFRSGFFGTNLSVGTNLLFTSPGNIISTPSSGVTNVLSLNAGGLTTSSGNQNSVGIYPTTAQSGTAGYKVLSIGSYETSTGSGAKYLIDAGNYSGAAGSGTYTTRFSVTTAGVMTLATAPTTSTGGSYDVVTRNTSTGVIEKFAAATAPTASAIVARDANGNTQVNAITQGFTTTALSAGTTTLTSSSTPIQVFTTGSATHTVVLPVTSTLVTGKPFTVINNSTGAVTVQSSGANNIMILPAGSKGIFTVVSTSGTTAASWFGDYWLPGTARVVAAQNTQALNTSNSLTETTVLTLTIPANSIGPNGHFEIKVLWSMTSNAGGKTGRIKIAGTTVAQAVLPVSNANVMSITSIFNRNSLTSQVSAASTSNANLVYWTNASSSSVTTYTFNTATDLTLTGTLQNQTNTTDQPGIEAIQVIAYY